MNIQLNTLPALIEQSAAQKTCGCGPDCTCGPDCACGETGACNPACTCGH